MADRRSEPFLGWKPARALVGRHRGRAGAPDRLRDRTRRILLLLGLLLCSLLGCPRRFDASATPSLDSPDPVANQAFRRARQLFDDRTLERAEGAFSEFVARHPDDLLAPLARVYLGRIALLRDRLPVARDQLSAVIAATREGDAEHADGRGEVARMARFHLGLVQVRLGAHDEGRRLLQPFVETASQDTLPAVLAALATSSAELADHLAAATHLDRLHEITTRPVEKAWARARLAHAVQQLSEPQLRSLYATGLGGRSPLLALVAQRLATIESSAGNQAAATQIGQQTAEVRALHGVTTPSESAAVRAGAIGLLLPFDDRYRAAGRLALAGATFGSSVFRAEAATGGSATLLVRDSSQQFAAAAAALIARQQVVALIGTLDPGRTGAIARLASAHQIPFLSLSSAKPTAVDEGTTLRLMPSNEQRVRALALHAAARGAGRGTLAVLAPDSSYGRGMASTFVAEARRRGAHTVASLFYPPRTASFTGQARDLARAGPFQVLFVPDSARNLALITPALALAGLWPSPPGARLAKGRAIRLLATADGLSPQLLVRAGRYVQGAVLAPGFFADDSAPDSGPLVRAFRQAHGRDPGLVEAFACDAVRAVRSHLQRGARDRRTLLAALRERPVAGLTGKLRFERDGRRADSPLLYEVRGERIVQLPQR